MNDGIQRDDIQIDDNFYTAFEYEFGTNILDTFIDLLEKKELSDTVVAQPARDTKSRFSEMFLLRVKSGIAVCIPTPTAQDIYSSRVSGQGSKTRILRQIRVQADQATSLQRPVASNISHG